MNKFHAFVFIIGTTFVHLACCAIVAGNYIGCNDRVGCVGIGTKVFGYILGFPLNLVSWIWQAPDQPISRATMIGVLANSLFAACILCFLVNRVLRRRES